MKNARLIIRFIILSISAVISIGLFIHFYWLDGIGGAILELMIGKTEYSKDYKEYKFRRVHRGMTESQILDILGEPLFKNVVPNNRVLWFYTYGEKIENQPRYVTNSCYTERIITFRNNLVVEVYHGFYID